MFELNGKVCLVTGGSRGLGESMAITFAKAGAEAVIITYNSDENKAIEVCKSIETHGSKSMAIHLEASNLESIKKMVTSVETSCFLSVLLAKSMMRQLSFLYSKQRRNQFSKFSNDGRWFMS